MANSYPAWLLKTRRRAAAAAVVTVLVFVNDIVDEFYRTHTKHRWLLSPYGTHHGWPLIAVNFAFYAYILWGASWFIRRSHPLERLFLIGWATGVLLWPFAWLRPQWSLPRLVGFIGITISLFTAVSVFVVPAIIKSGEPKDDVT